MAESSNTSYSQGDANLGYRYQSSYISSYRCPPSVYLAYFRLAEALAEYVDIPFTTNPSFQPLFSCWMTKAE